MPTSGLTPIAAFWDSSADTFDDEPDHGLRDPHVRAAWARRLAGWLPGPSADVLDLGCGTGSLTLLLAQLGHHPTAIDLSPRMIAQAERKLSEAGFAVPLIVGDAGDPPGVGRHAFDAIVVRHLVWTLPAPEEALRRWLDLLRPDGRLILVEGRWGGSDAGGSEGSGADGDGSHAGGSDGDRSDGDDDSVGSSSDAGGSYAPGSPPLPWLGGVPAVRLIAALEPHARILHTEHLTDPALWGRPISDERYVVIAQAPRPHR
ncbi:class I SAM-dependent methyltransferase [Nonomuraea sp. NPDC004354]